MVCEPIVAHRAVVAFNIGILLRIAGLPFPDSADADRSSVRILDAPVHQLTGLVGRLENIFGRDDAELLFLPSVAERGLGGHRLDYAR